MTDRIETAEESEVKQYKSVAALNLGCKTNRYETDAVLADFGRIGYELVGFHETADIYIINTCSVTGEAGRKSGQMVRRARKQNPRSIVVAMGCHVELGAESLGADILVGNRGKNRVPQLVEQWSEMNPDGHTRDRLNYRAISGSLNTEREPQFEEFSPQVVQSESRGILKIQDGCNHFCTYCAIPLARGRVRSRSRDLVLSEARQLTARGYRELVLTGIHICSYGQDWQNQTTDSEPIESPYQTDTPGRSNLPFIDLVEELGRNPDLKRLRLGSIEPKSVTAGFARRLGRIAVLCPHVHLSLQSGSDIVLKRMNRRYTADEYRTAVKNLKQAIPNVNLTTDLIVGFPGETDADHEESLRFCKEIGFGRIHIFRYSARANTPAAKFKNQVPADVSARRSEDFHVLAKRLWLERANSRVGETACVLLESKREDGSWIGYSEAYDGCSVRFGEGIDEEQLEGDIWNVLVRAVGDDDLLVDAVKLVERGFSDS